MSVDILWDDSADVAALYCTTTDWAFGPVFQGPDAAEKAQSFLDFLNEDPRTLNQATLAGRYSEWSGDALDDDGRLLAAP